MRVATYSQPAIAAQGSVVALMVLVLTVVLGSSALHTLMTHFAPALHSLIAVLWLMTYMAAFFGLMFNHGINWVSWLARYRILLVILLLGTTVSVAWSLDAAVSAERVVHLLGCSVLAIYLGFMIPLLTTLRVTAVVLGVIMIASLAAALAMPSVGMQEYEGKIVWSGILNSKNALGFWAAIAVLLYIALSASSATFLMKCICYVMAIISLFVLVKSESATSLLAMLLAGALSLYLYIAFRFQLGFIRMVVLAVLFGGLLAFAFTNIDTAEIVGRSGDLTGRGEVWRQTWKLIMAKPLTGYGYGSIWFPNDATIWMQQSLTDFTWVVYHAHNGFLQVASEIGLPLSCIALLMVAQQLIEIFYCQYERQQVGVLFVLAFVVAYLVSNFSEARFLVNRELYWIFFLALPISMLRQINLVSVDDFDDEPDAPYGAAGGAYVPADKPWLRPVDQTAAARIGGGLAVDTPRIQFDSAESHLNEAEHDVSADVTADITSNLPHITLSQNDIAENSLGDTDVVESGVQSPGIDVGEMDVSGSDDPTLDTSQAIDEEEFNAFLETSQVELTRQSSNDSIPASNKPIEPDDTHGHVYDHDMTNEDPDIMDKTIEYHPDDYRDSAYDDEPVIRAYEVYDNDSDPTIADIDADMVGEFNTNGNALNEGSGYHGSDEFGEDKYEKKLRDDDGDEFVDISLGDDKPR